jgi:ABC-type sugar transport system permease subunit
MNKVSNLGPQTKKQGENNAFTMFLRLFFLLLFDLGAGWFIYQAIQLGSLQLAGVVGVVFVMINVILLLPQAYAYRWMVTGLSFLILFTIYPMLFTIYVAFTNFGEGHLLSQQKALEVIQQETYLPKSGASYKWTAFKSKDGSYALWLVDPNGNSFLGKVDSAITPAKPGDPGIGPADAKGIPTTLAGYDRLNAILAATDKNLTKIKFGAAGNSIQISSSSEAAELKPLYAYNAATNTLTDEQTGEVFYDKYGTYTSQMSGKQIVPGYQAVIGFKNFTNFLQSPALRGPLLQILSWNFIFPFFSVVLTFSLGLAIALMFNDKRFPFKKVFRTLLLVPYTIPQVITILIWRGLMNPDLGVINSITKSLFNFSPPWFSEPLWAQAAIVLVSVWLGYPYFMLIASGALQSISPDLYEAATIDGATSWQAFRNITLPLLLVAVGPLLIASYVFNFNNFGLIYLFINGGPPIVGASTQAGHTDILISYVYNLAFSGGGRGVQYGLASAISIFIFLFVGAITMLQFRFTNMWEEVSKNV